MSPKYFIKTYGCQMNVADSAKLGEVVRGMGYEETTDQELADIVLVNTCVVRQNAEDRAAWFIQSLKGQKKVNPNLKIGVCGCYVTEPGRDLKKQFPHVDFFIPPNGAEELTSYLKPHTDGVGDGVRGMGKANFVTIMHGCDNYCSYCVVPYVRGRETSRPMDEVLQEIGSLVDQGSRVITLLGQNVNSFEFGLANLLREIPNHPSTHLPINLTIKFMTSHPKDMSDEIIEAVATLPYVAKEFHLPLQAGDDEILARMNRGYTVDYFRQMVKRIRAALPAANISTDVMVGFPGETEVQFEGLLSLIKELKFSMVNMFAFSARPSTAAAAMSDQIPDAIKQARLQKLIKVVREIVR